MARHLTSRLKRTFMLTKRLMVYEQSLPHRCMSHVTEDPKFLTTKGININFDEPKDFKEFNDGWEWGSGHAIDVLTKLLCITRKSATEIIRRYPAFTTLPRKSIDRNFEIVRQAGICKSTIIDNNYLLSDETKELARKLKLVKKLDLDMNDCVSLFNLSCSDLTRLINLINLDTTFVPHRNRILYLTERLKQDISRICRFLSYNRHILFMAAPKLLSITEFLLESGVTPAHIMTDPIVFKYEFSLIKERVTFAKNAGIKPLKTWVVRCPASVMDTCVRRHSRKTEAISPYKSMPEFLCALFECSQADVDALYVKLPMLHRTNYTKVVNNARFVHAEGYTINDLQRSPTILNRKLETLLRLSEVCRENGFLRPPLSLYTMREKEFLAALTKRTQYHKNLIAAT